MSLFLDATLSFTSRSPLRIRADLSAPVTGVFGPSGAGKTSLLGAIAGFPSRVEGRISLAGTTLLDTAAARAIWVPPEHRRIAIASQPPQLFPHLSVIEQLKLARNIRKKTSLSLEQLLVEFELTDQKDQLPGELSGGEGQRLALARALASEPQLLLLDEVFTGLDMSRRARLIERTSTHLAALSIPCLVVSHDARVLMAMASETLVLGADGSATLGPTAALLSQGQKDAFNVLSCEVESHEAGLFQLRSGGFTLFSSSTTLSVGTTAQVSVSAADIVILRERPAAVSARNLLPATVEDLRELAENRVRLRVSIEGSVEFLVDVTRDAQAELGLKTGAPCFILFKANRVEHVG